MIIGCDIDEVINDQICEVLKLYNAKYNDDLSYFDITDYAIQQFLKPDCKHLFQEFCDDYFIENLIMQPDDIEALTELNNTNELYFCTARHPYVMEPTDRWLEKYLPWYRSGHLVRIKNKQLLNIDVLIDDSIENLIGGTYKKILVNRPWNEKYENVNGIFRVDNLSEAYEIIKVMIALEEC